MEKFALRITYLFLGLLFILKVNALPTDYGQSGHLQFRNITSIEGLSNNTVYDITQDSDDFIWIATHEGLNKFDGGLIQSYYHDSTQNSIPGNFVKKLLVSSSGNMFVGTDNGVCVYDKKRDLFKQLLINGKSIGNVDIIAELSSKAVLISASGALFSVDTHFNVKKIANIFARDFCEYKKGIIWAASSNGIFLINADGEIIKEYNNKTIPVQKFDFTANNIACFYKDSRGIIWLGTTRNGLGYYKPETDEFINLKLKEGVNPVEDNFVRAINEDQNGQLWIGTESGLYIYNIEKQEFNFYGQSFDPLDKGLNDKAIYSIFKSSDDLMWVGTYFGGVNYTSTYSSGFINIYADGGKKRLSGNAVSEIIQTRNKDIWIATEDGGISIYHPQTNMFTYINHRSNNPYSLSSNNVHALEEDDAGNIWIGTFIGGLNKYNSSTGQIIQVKLSGPDTDPVQNVFSIKIDNRKRIWVGAISGLYVMNPGEVNFTMFRPDIFNNNFIYHVDQDKDNNIWICTYYDGVYKLDPNNKLQHFNQSSSPQILSNQFIYFFNDYQNKIWFGTVEGGLLKYDPSNNTFESFTTNDGLPNNTVYAVTEDILGNIWFSTNKGIVSLNPANNHVRTYNEHDGLIGNQFNYKSCLTMNSGIIYFGAVNGLTLFEPVKLPLYYNDPKIHFTDFKLFNSSLKIGEKGILNYQVDDQDKIVLKHKYNVFTLSFVGLNYLYPKNNQYAYYLEGFENDWNYVGNKNNATYTNLSAGKYIFHVKVSTNQDNDYGEEKILKIRILPPFWLSAWGLTIYFIVIFILIYTYWNYQVQKHKSSLELQLAQMEKEKNEAINQHRLDFFTYISHEFKTPLTIVIASIEQLLEYKDIIPQIKNHGLMIKKNALRLLSLIDQLMDFRKIETEHTSLKLNQGNIISFLESIFNQFIPILEKKSIKGEFITSIPSYNVYFDADKIEKIVTNLLSNSCNALEKEGKIMLDVKILERISISDPSREENRISDLILIVEDDGSGFPASKMDQLFDPFYSNGKSNEHRSGIGLALVNSLVKFLKGKIEISGEMDKGAKITIQLPLIHNPKPEFIQSNQFIETNKSIDIDNLTLSLDQKQSLEENEITAFIDNKFELLIVEDNKDLLSFLSHYFSRSFKVSKAFDGKSALKKIEESQPDIVISDIMMPEMDGYSLCKEIKNSIALSHIPVILLTAKSGAESRLEGLNLGADAYINKPFNLKELELIIRNILKTRQSIRNNFINNQPIQNSVVQLNNKDQKFIQKLTDIIYDHLDDTDFNVDIFCKEILISRTLLHVKLKKITGLTTTEFIKNIRLNEAKKMLSDGNFTVAEIAYKVGFADPAYFSKSFKKLFDVSPSSLFNNQEDPDACS